VHKFLNIPLQFSFEDFFKNARIDGDSEFAGEARSKLEPAVSLIQPKAVCDVLYAESREGDSIVFDRVTFTSKVLTENLKDIHRVFPYIATCGTELEDFPGKAEDPLLEYWIDTVKEMALHAAIETVRNWVETTYEIKQVSSMNPGSADAHVWPIRQQREMFSVFGNVEEIIGVKLTESHLMIPNKSVSGIYFPTDRAFINCTLCHREACPNRRAPFKGTVHG
jgi:hypothetical protein